MGRAKGYWPLEKKDTLLVLLLCGKDLKNVLTVALGLIDMALI